MKLIFTTPKSENFFFGYFGKSQLNKSNDKLLCLKTNFINRIPTKQDSAEIGFFNLKTSEKKFNFLARTKTFNWQQGCMLQWLGPRFEDEIIYNDIIENKFCSIILNIKTKKKIKLPLPIYDINFNSKFAICVDQERHFFCRRGYSYAGIDNIVKNKKIVKGDGIWLLDVKTKKITQIINIKDLINFKPLSNMKDSTHYVEHLSFRPDAQRFCFLHRWKMKEGGIYSRFYTVNLDGSELNLLLDSGRMSHFCWRNNSEILAYGGVPNSVNKLRKKKNLVKFIFKPLLPLFHFLFNDNSFISKLATGDSYILLNDKSKKIHKVASELRFEDGHPSFFPQNKNIFVTDLYPKQSNNHKAKLMTFDLKDNKLTIIDVIKSNKKFDESPIRCDLHPKISFDGNYVSIDTLHKNYRGVNLYKISIEKVK